MPAQRKTKTTPKGKTPLKISASLIHATQRVIYVSSDVVAGACELGCGRCFNEGGRDDLAGTVNHYLEHGLVLLHVGQESGQDRDCKPYQKTVAVLAA